MTIIEANNKLDNIYNQLSYYRKELEKEYRKSGLSASKIKEVVVDGGFVDDVMLNTIIRIVELQDIIRGLEEDKKGLEEFIEKEERRIFEYDDRTEAIVYLKEQSRRKYTWWQISGKIHVPESTCRKLYNDWKRKK